MTEPPRAAIFFYDEESGEFKVCNIQRSKLQPFIDRAVVMPFRSTRMTPR